MPKNKVQLNLAIFDEPGWSDSESDCDSEDEEVSPEVKRVLDEIRKSKALEK